MSEDFWIAVVGAVSLIVVAAIGVWRKDVVKTRKILVATHEQVVNDHGDKPNLREDIDEIKDALQVLLAWRIRHDDERALHMQRTSAVESAMLMVTARLGEGENRFVEMDRKLRVIDERLEAHAGRLRARRKDDL